jgi:Tol biopolymer transport system component
VITQAGQLSQAVWSENGLRAEKAPAIKPEKMRWMIDTGTPSPDGKTAAFTTLGNDTGGPVLLQDLATGTWTNLIEAVNNKLSKQQPALSMDYWWDVIGWFPDSKRLMIGPGDLSMVVIVDRESFKSQVIIFPGGGKGGRMFVNLAPDGSHFLFIGDDEKGEQVLSTYDLASGTVTTLREAPYEQGVISQPRYAPDGEKIAYIVQKGQPEKGLAFSLDMMPAQAGEPRTLAKGNLVMAVPAWSPDGRYIAFTRDDAQPDLRFAPGSNPAPLRGNVWIVFVDNGKETQITSLDGLARSPTWASDSKTLAFVTQDGQVGMTSIETPGQIWQAAAASPDFPDLTSVFILP